MGCSVGKLDSRKLHDQSIIGVNAMQIQTVLQLKANDIKSLKDVKQSSKSARTRRHKRNDSSAKKKGEVRHKSPRSKNEKTIKPVSDTNITVKYDIKAVIGKGSFSRVLRVEHRQTKQPYALKIIEAPGGREAFDAEHSVLRRLNHPNVIRLIEVFDSNNKVYMVMELATGGSLLDRLEARGYLTEDDSRDVLRMVLHGVRYLHALGITHRDLKPDNLLYYHPGKESKLMITDFSFASSRRKAGNPYMQTVCGTPQYIAPEIVTRKPYTCAVDMWAVGVITYIVLCGVFPFDAEQDAQIFKLILRGEVEMSNSIWRDLSEESKLFVHQLLQTDPINRLSAETALQHKWLTSSKLTFSPPRNQDRHKSDHRSLRSSRSVGSSKSGGSVHSLRVSGHRRVQIQHLEALSCDPEVAAMM